MVSRDVEARYVTLVDLPLLRRLGEKSVVLDSELSFTHTNNDVLGTFVSSVILPQRGLYTLVARSGAQQVVGQFRLKSDDLHAHVVYLAPDYHSGDDDTPYLYLLDAMAREAGRSGAHALLAEVNEHSPLFEMMRTSGYAVYARQEIWVRQPGVYPSFLGDVTLKEESAQDLMGVNALMHSTMPALVQQFALPPSDMPRLVYRPHDRVEGYIAYAEGKHGIYMIPYLHPDVMSNAPSILDAAIRMIPRSDRVPVFVCVRRYQDWVCEALAELAFEPFTQQALMVKHMTAGVHRATFNSLKPQLQVVGTRVKPPTNRCGTRVILYNGVHSHPTGGLSSESYDRKTDYG